jgi:hypothetical protein
MTTDNRTGMCAAYGCPLFATMGRDGKWFCHCHAYRTNATNDAVTLVLNANLHIVNAILDTRRFGNTDEWATVKAGIAKALREADRADLLPGAQDCHAGSTQPEKRQWLQRLERELLELTRHVGEQMQLSSTVPSAPVIGPTHASNFHPYADGGVA